MIAFLGRPFAVAILLRLRRGNDSRHQAGHSGAKGERFGQENLESTLTAKQSGGPAGIVAHIFAAVDAFAGAELHVCD